MKLPLRVIYLTILLFTPFINSKSDDIEKILIGYVEHPQIDIYKTLINKSYNDIGIQVNFVGLTNERNLLALNKRVIDATVAGLSGVEHDFPNITKVNIPLVNTTTYLICVYDVICNESILYKPEVTLVSTKRDFIRANKQLNLQIEAQHMMFERSNVILELLMQNRANYALFTVEKQKAPSDILIHLQNHKLLSVTAFHYVHKDLNAIIPRLKEALRKNLDMLKLKSH